MERIAIFGGTFNPIHNEHIEVAKSAVKELKLDKLFVVPTFIPPHKASYEIDPKHRLNMLKLAFSGDEKIEVSDFEIESKGTSYSYITAEYFKKKYNCQVYMIVGGDMLADFKTWKYPERILDSVTLCAFLRDGFSINLEKEQEYFRKTFNKEFKLLSYVGKNYSSTKIRVYNSFGLDILPYTDKNVVKYIKENNLYAGKDYQREVKNRITEKRLIHTANVVLCALKKVKELNLDKEKVIMATSLHDIAKYTDYKTVKGFTLPPNVPEPVIHSFLGAYIAENELNIKDEDVINAIRFHTSGRANMSNLERLTFVADMIEEGRDYEGVDILRKAYEESFDKCFIECIKEEIKHLINKKTYIYIETLNCYDYYITKRK